MTPTLKVIRLRPATGDDAKLILWLEEAAMKDYATALWGDWQPSATAATLDVSSHEMVEAGNRIVGCIATRTDGVALHLTRLYLAPDARNQGIGATVLRQIIERATAQGSPVRLRVLSNNPAFQFYRRYGFHTERETQEHIYMIYDSQIIRPKGAI